MNQTLLQNFRESLHGFLFLLVTADCSRKIAMWWWWWWW